MYEDPLNRSTSSVTGPVTSSVADSVAAGTMQAMALREKVRLLSLVDILEPLSAEALESFARRTPTMHLRNDQLFHTPNRRGGPFMLLLEGKVRIYKVAAGKELTLAVEDAGTMLEMVHGSEAARRGVKGGLVIPPAGIGDQAGCFRPQRTCKQKEKKIKSLIERRRPDCWIDPDDLSEARQDP